MGSRLGHLWLAKMLATTLGISAFFVAYFWVLHHPQFAITLMPLTTLDRWIDFRVEALPVYLSLWVYVSLAPALLGSRSELVSYGLATLAMALVGLGIFMLWPTAVPVFAVDLSANPSIAFLKSVDVAANACPSLHVAFAVFTAIWLAHLLAELQGLWVLRVLNWVWCLAILYSTVATRQHVVLDVLAGAALGSVVAVLHLQLLNRGAWPAPVPVPVLAPVPAQAQAGPGPASQGGVTYP